MANAVNGWPSGWEVYYVVFLSAALALALPLSVTLLSRLSRMGKRAPVAPIRENFVAAAPAPMVSKRMNTRFFLAANASLVLLTLALILIPCVGTLQKEGDGPMAVRGLISVITIATFSAIGLLYSARKGDLSWLRSFERSKFRASADRDAPGPTSNEALEAAREPDPSGLPDVLEPSEPDA